MPSAKCTEALQLEERVRSFDEKLRAARLHLACVTPCGGCECHQDRKEYLLRLLATAKDPEAVVGYLLSDS
jgi:hypothetical protein